VTVLFVSRLAVRNDADLVVGPQNRLVDPAGEVRVGVTGHRSLWPDHRSLLRDVRPREAFATRAPGGR
jgi:hypothetical protein